MIIPAKVCTRYYSRVPRCQHSLLFMSPTNQYVWCCCVRCPCMNQVQSAGFHQLCRLTPIEPLLNYLPYSTSRTVRVFLVSYRTSVCWLGSLCPTSAAFTGARSDSQTATAVRQAVGATGTSCTLLYTLETYGKRHATQRQRCPPRRLAQDVQFGVKTQTRERRTRYVHGIL